MTRIEARKRAVELANTIKEFQTKQYQADAIVSQLDRNNPGSEKSKKAMQAAQACKRKVKEAMEELESVKVVLKKDFFGDETLEEVESIINSIDLPDDIDDVDNDE